MQIKIEDFAARRIINFFASEPVAKEGVAAVGVAGQKGLFPLLQNIVAIDGVTRGLVCDRLVGVQYADGADLAQIKALVLAEIDDYIAEGKSAEAEDTVVSLLERIEALTDSLVRPTLYRDNGGIEVLSVENGVVLMAFTGHCAGCPYAQNTLNNVVAKTLKKYLPQIRAVQIKE